MIKVTAIPYQVNCEGLFNLVRDLPFACWLDSGKPQSEYGRYDIISALPASRLVTNKYQTTIYDCKDTDYTYSQRLQSDKDPLSLLQCELNNLTQTKEASQGNGEQDSNIDSPIPFAGGAIGYFSYDLHQLLKSKQYVANSHKSNKKQDSNFDDMQVGIYHWAIIQDHLEQKAYIASLPECNPLTLQTITRKLHNLSNHTLTQDKPTLIQVEPLKPTLSREEYTNSLETINDYILAGDTYQVNFAQRFQGQYQGDPYMAYQQLRGAMASPFSAYLQLGKQAIMSLSPERFLKVENNHVLTQPIKGTLRRDSDPKIDKQRANTLQKDEKNRAENVMIVDLLRNDIGQHCIPGSISVETLFGLQSFPNVHHLVSDIVGTLSDQSNSLDLFRDCFPGGSITGAPKKRAMEIIDELESGSRGVYCGSIGYINNNGDMDSNIAIRTVSCDGHQLTCWGGGGIVADSTIDDEYQESLDKINRILSILSPQ